MGVNRSAKKRLYTGLWVMLAVLLLAGCGSGSDNDSASKSMADTAAGGGAGYAEMSSSAFTAGEAASTGDSGGAEVSPAAGSLAGAPIGAEGRKIVYRGTVTIETEDFGQAQTALMNAVHQSDGYILTFEDTLTSYEKGATYTIKVPAAGFSSFLDRIGAIPNTFYERKLSGTDVSEEYVDLEARLRARQAAEARLLDFMAKASRADELVSFSQQLANVQEEIERIKGRIRYLDQNVAYSTVELRLYQPLEPEARAARGKDSLGERMMRALTTGWDGAVQVIEALLIFAAGALPVLAVLAVPAGIGWAIARSLRKRRPSSPSGRPNVYVPAERPHAPQGGQPSGSAPDGRSAETQQRERLEDRSDEAGSGDPEGAEDSGSGEGSKNGG